MLGIGASRAYASIKRKWPYLTFLWWMSNFCTLTTPRTLFASLVETKGKKTKQKESLMTAEHQAETLFRFIRCDACKYCDIIRVDEEKRKRIF